MSSLNQNTAECESVVRHLLEMNMLTTQIMSSQILGARTVRTCFGELPKIWIKTPHYRLIGTWISAKWSK